MENKKPSDISANDLLAKLKANIQHAEADTVGQQRDSRKKYRFRRSSRVVSPMTEEEILAEMPGDGDDGFVSPVPKSDIEDLDLDALMRKYLPEEDYERMTSAKTVSLAEEDEFVRTLSSIDIVTEDVEATDANETYAEHEATSLTAPDSDLYDRLSEGGKVCDVPEIENRDEMSDTRQAPLRPMSDTQRTIAFGHADEESEEGGFISVRELLAAETVTMPLAEAVDNEEGFDKAEPNSFVTGDAPTAALPLVDEAATVEIPMPRLSLADEVNAIADEAEAEEECFEETVVFDGIDSALDDASEDLSAFEEEYALKEEPTFEEEDLMYVASEVEEIPTGVTTEEKVSAVSEEAAVDALEQATVVAVDEQAEFENGEAFEDKFDEIDANLMLAFGMDEELDATIGKESADKLRAEMDRLVPEGEEKPEKKYPEPEQIKEFVSPAETKDILDAYKDEYGKSALRMFGIIAVAIILFFYENVGIFGGQLIDAFNPAYYPVVHIMVGLQVLLIGFALLYKSMVDGVKGLLARRPTTESYLPLLLLVAILYSALACFFPAGTTLVSFHFPIALCLLFEVIGERMNLRREIMAFRVVSSKRIKFALEKLDIDDAELETKAFNRFLPKQPDIFRINKTSFVDGYFTRTKKYPSIKLVLNAYLPALLIALVVGLIVGLVTERSFASAVMLAYASFAFCMPATVFFTFSLPAFRAGKLAFADHSAVIGEAALDEYTSAASISFDDREVFPTAGVKLRSIKVFGSGRLDTVIYYMAAVYSELGGPLADVLRVATADLGHSEDVEILTLENDGVEAIVDRHHLFVGKGDYLRANGYLPVSDPDDEEIEGGDTSILFLVCDDEVVAKVYARYRIDPEFERTLKNLYRSGICVGIKTIDPNINDDMLSTRIRLSKYPVRVLKYTEVSETRRGSERTDSGIVSRKSVKALLRAFTLCDKIKHITKTNLLINALTMVVGLILVLAVAFLGSIGAVSSVYVALFQLFWLLPIYLITKFLLM